MSTRRPSMGLVVLLFHCALLGSSAAGERLLPGLSAEVSVFTDTYGIPHIYARSWPDACRTLGYLHARDRLWEMDVFRRQAFGTTAEIFGPDALASDQLVRRLGIRRGCEALWESREIPQALRDQLEAYTSGVNARLAELGPQQLPPAFQALGYQPQPWKPVDCLSFGKYMGWDQSGTEDDLWFGEIVARLGVEAAESLWPLDRPYEIPAVAHQADRDDIAAVGTSRPFSVRAFFEWSSGEAEDRMLAFSAARRTIASAGWYGRGDSFGSNNWAVDGTKTASGKPILSSDPHLGFKLPSLWYACHMSVDGRNVCGVTFPGSPIVVIGHNDRLGWGITNMQADAVDYFVETVDPEDPLKYLHRGQWKTMERITETIPVRGQAPVEFTIDSTVHGPVVTREGRCISLQWPGVGPTTDMIGFWEMNHARNLRQWLAAADKMVVPVLNLAYADADGHIVLHPCGALPKRLPGQGRVPMDGASGENDWTEMIPRDKLPLAVDPPEHYVASANGRPAASGYPYYLGWMWDASYRVRRIHEMLSAASGMTVDKMRALQFDTHDKCAERFLPGMLEGLPEASLSDPLELAAAAELRSWDFEAGVESSAPIIWLRWLDLYRSGVWDDEWESRGLKKQSGSWGFSGTNRREPMLEVLEYMTREYPTSIWFDDRATPGRETRDDIARRTFQAAVASLKKDFGPGVPDWKWGKINRLKIDSLSGREELSREGGPVPGTSFTVNPGSGGGTVGGGASWRMIVDFGDVQGSIGVYPGGQSEDPQDPHYADQIPLWASGNYIPLTMVSSPDQLHSKTRAHKLTLKP